MAFDVKNFIEEHSIQRPTLIGHSMSVERTLCLMSLSWLTWSRGAKVAMTAALLSPETYQSIVCVDNAPVATEVENKFGKYLKGMRQIEQAGVSTMAAADNILQKYEEVSFIHITLPYLN